MNAYTFYYSMSIIIVRKLRLNDICGEQCLHPFASFWSSFELHFNPFLCNEYTFLWRLISISIFIRIFVFLFLHWNTLHSLFMNAAEWGHCVCSVQTSGTLEYYMKWGIVWKHTYILQKGVGAMAAHCLLKNKYGKGIICVCDMWMCFFFVIPYPMPHICHCWTWLTHLNHTVCEYEFIHTHFILFVAFFCWKINMHVNSACEWNERDFEFSTYTIEFVGETYMDEEEEAKQ